MTVKWTSEQQKAIDKKSCNLLVAAAAGSGKTAVLVEKIVNLIEGGVDVDSLLVTTFTDAAAKKMKAEIGDEIKKRLMNNPSKVHLSRQLMLLSLADICTIDSFCMKIVRSSFHLLDIDPDFKIADANESELLRMQAVGEVFDELYEENDDAFYNLLDCYATQRGDESLEEVLLALHSFARTIPDYKAWLERCKEIYTSFSGNIFDTPWGEVIKSNTKITLDGCIQCAVQAHDYAVQIDEMGSYTVPLGIDIAALKEIKNILECGSFDDVAKKVREYKNASGGRAKPKTPDEVKEPVAENRAYIKNQMGKLASEFYYASEEEICEEILYTSAQVSALCDIARRIEERFFEIKNKRGLLDFADIEHLALKALTSVGEDGNVVPSEVACELKDKYEMILIDEYQDSNELQETIFSRISREDNIFMVGDLKQSIYRFRHTNPLLFKRKKDTYNDDEGINQRVIMSKNFRSQKNIIDFVNFIMSQNASEVVGELDYDVTEMLNFGADFADTGDNDTSVEVHLIEDNNADEGEENENVFGAEAEAVRVAKRILQLKSEGFCVFDKKEGLRPVKYKDIVILMRSPSVDAEIFSQVLTSFGIPTFSDVGGGYFMSEEVELMLCLLSVIDNPLQDIKLLSVMRSVIGNFDDTELMDIRLCDNESDIYGALCSCARNDTPLGKKCAAFIKRLEDWRKRSLYMSVHELISYLYEDTLYYEFAGALSSGEQKRANLDLLIEYARGYEKTSFKGLFNFVSYAERVKGASRDFGAAKTLGENQDVVRIMSIHKSKGLEFGVVFVSRLAKRFNTRDLSNAVLVHGELGIGVDLIDIKNRYKYPSFIKRAIKEKLRCELLSEELRVLYVALTRARDKLILTLAPGVRENKKKKWLSGARGTLKDALPLYYTSSASGLSDWVMGAMMRCDALREYAGEYISCEGVCPDIKFFNSSEFLNTEADKKENEALCVHNDEMSELIEKKLGYEYPHKYAQELATKVSVTEMKRAINNDADLQSVRLDGEQMTDMPLFMKEASKLSGAQKGSAMHFVMQNLDLSGVLDENGVKKQLDDMTERGIIDKKQAQSISCKKIAGFFKGELGKRMLSSECVVREAPFEIEIGADKIAGAYACGEMILLQGIIDCYFYEGDKIVLVDYKTDFVQADEDVKRIKDKYELQLDLYAQALEKITGKCVKEKNLYLFSCENVIKYK
ncbi:MAG: helicase-exonuclease AddAB subunit AddA [Ruminococcaceae bacterium]|nr:helicase-exonuclease AddAB subunit AddA [Oscillospiraceae bacterium]